MSHPTLHQVLRRFAVLLALIALASIPRPSVAQNRDTAIAEALFRDGRRLMAVNAYDKACPKFEESFRRVPKLGTLLNMATCHDKQGKTGSAWDEYTRAISMAKDAGEEDRVKYAREQLDALEGRLSRIVIEVETPAEGLDVLMDGKSIGTATLGTPIPLDPGEHLIEARLPGQEPWSKSVTLPAGPHTTTVELPEFANAKAEQPAPPATSSTAPPPPAPPRGAGEQDDPGAGQRAAGWIVGAIGIVGLGVGAGFGIDTILKSGDSDDHCNGELCDQDGVDLREKANVSANVSNVGFGVGLAAVIVGVILLATAPSADETEPSAQAGAEAWIHPFLGPQDGGLSFGGRW